MHQRIKLKPWEFFIKPKDLLNGDFKLVHVRDALLNWKLDIIMLMKATSEGMSVKKGFDKKLDHLRQINDCLLFVDSKIEHHEVERTIRHL